MRQLKSMCEYLKLGKFASQFCIAASGRSAGSTYYQRTPCEEGLSDRFLRHARDMHRHIAPLGDQHSILNHYQ